jgi:alkylhydroperoxidase/carboxymuconolactone decarboxylase family protein YurZ
MGVTEAEIAEALDVALIMSGTLSGKSVRHAYRVMLELRGEGI